MSLYFQVPEIGDEEACSPDNSSTVSDWKTSRPVSRSSSVASTRKYLSALTPQVSSSLGEKKNVFDLESVFHMS